VQGRQAFHEFIPVASAAKGAEKVRNSRHPILVDEDVIRLEVAMSATVQLLESNAKFGNLPDHEAPQQFDVFAGAIVSVARASCRALQHITRVRALVHSHEVTHRATPIKVLKDRYFVLGEILKERRSCLTDKSSQGKDGVLIGHKVRSLVAESLGLSSFTLVLCLGFHAFG